MYSIKHAILCLETLDTRKFVNDIYNYLVYIDITNRKKYIYFDSDINQYVEENGSNILKKVVNIYSSLNSTRITILEELKCVITIDNYLSEREELINRKTQVFKKLVAFIDEFNKSINKTSLDIQRVMKLLFDTPSSLNDDLYKQIFQSNFKDLELIDFLSYVLSLTQIFQRTNFFCLREYINLPTSGRESLLELDIESEIFYFSNERIA